MDRYFHQHEAAGLMKIRSLAAAVMACAGLIVVPVRGEEVAAVPVEEAAINRIDLWHDSTYRFLHRQVERVDGWFVPEGEAHEPIPPSQFRLGLFGQSTIGVKNDFEMVPLVDFETDVSLPDAERRLKVFVSTLDPTALPGEDAFERDNGLRVGASREWLDEFKLTAGVRARWLPEAYAVARWAPSYTAGNWQLYPQQKFFAETDKGVGGLTSFMADHWRNRWDFRQALSLKWTTKYASGDEDNETDTNSAQFGDNGGGWRWEYTTIFGYAKELLEEKDLGRRINGSDLADGFGVRFTVSGDAAEAGKARILLFRKAPLHSRWLYYVISPEVNWSDENDWGRELVIKVGLEALLWGTPSR